MYNNEMIEKIYSKMNGVTVKKENGHLTVSHKAEDWDLICLLAQRLMFVAERWMENQEAKTTIYLI